MRVPRYALVMALCALQLSAQQAPSAPPSVELPAKPQAKKPAPVMQNSIERQMDSVARQMDSLRAQYPAFWVRPPLVDAPTGSDSLAAGSADCAAASLDELRPIIDREAGKQQLDPQLVAAVMETESANKPCAVSAKGAMGLMQLMPATVETFRVGDPFDMSENVAAGAAFLKQLLSRYGGDTAKALAAYNAGPARVDSAGGIPDIAETKDYVRRIMEKLARDKPVGPGKIQ